MKHDGFLRVVTKLESRIRWVVRRLSMQGFCADDARSDIMLALWRSASDFEDEDAFLYYASVKLRYLQADQVRNAVGRGREDQEGRDARSALRGASEKGLGALESNTMLPDSALHRKRLLEAIEEAMPDLPSREHYILIEVYRNHRPQRELAKEMNLTEPRIQQLRVQAERRIRESVERKWALKVP